MEVAVSTKPHSKNKKQKDSQTFGSCQRTKKAEEHGSDSDTNYNWYS